MGGNFYLLFHEDVRIHYTCDRLTTVTSINRLALTSAQAAREPTKYMRSEFFSVVGPKEVIFFGNLKEGRQLTV